MSSNTTTISDEDGDYEDWIELYNGTDTVVNLFGFYLSNNISSLNKWQFPEIIIEPNEFLIIFASKKDRIEGEYLHTNFNISIFGEPILLSDNNNLIIDYFAPVELTTDNSYGRRVDGESDLVYFMGSTPGTTNNNQPIYIEYTEELFFSNPQGFYTESFNLEISCSDNDAEIYYTFNGSDPDTDDYLLEELISIVNRQQFDNTISTIRTNPESSPSSFRWKEPDEKIFKGTTIKARGFVDGEPITPIYTQTYIVHPEIFAKYNLPIISITTDSLNLFDYETGIYVPGIIHDNNPCWEWAWGTGNYHQSGFEWEKPANFTFFEKDGSVAFQQDVGIRIHGGGSRALPQKSLRIYARNYYGKSTIDYQFFPEKDVFSYNRILLRNSGQDFLTTFLTDAVTHKLVEEFDIETQSYRPTIVFINGEFWGIHNIRDRIDKYYFQYCCGANPEYIDYLDFGGAIVEGCNEDYNNIIDFIRENDLSIQSNYEFVETQIDIDNYIDYVIFKQFIAVYDWPGNNVEFWRKSDIESKWRWVFFDNDGALVNYSFDAIAHSTVEGGNSWPNPDWSTFLLRNLYKNETFVNKYLERFEYHFFETFTYENVNNHLSVILDKIEPVIDEHIRRWNYPSDYNTWDYNVSRILTFMENRPCYMLYHLINHFDIDGKDYAYGICDTLNYVEEVNLSIVHSLYPNPATEEITIQFEQYVFVMNLSVFDITGRLIYKQEFDSSRKKNNIKLNCSTFDSGQYHIVVNTVSNIFTERFIKIE